MAAKKLPPIRPQSRNPAHSRIRNLKCYPEVYNRILDGWTLDAIAKFIQEIKKESTDVTHGSLVVALQEFRASLPPAELTKKRMPQLFMEAAERVSEGLDEVEEMAKLYKLQMSRVQLDNTIENSIKETMPTLGQEVRIAKEILSAYADLKMSLGLSKRHIGKMEVEAKVLTDVAVRYENSQPEVHQVMSNPQSRQKILGLVEKLLTRTTAKVVGDSTEAQPVIDVEGREVPAREQEDDLFPEYGDDESAPGAETEDAESEVRP